MPQGNLRYVLLDNQRDKVKGKLYIQTRSLLGIMYYLSHGIDTPNADIKGGVVTQTLDLEGNPFSWDKITGDLIQVKTNAEKQNGAAVSINYKDRCFFINPSNLDSKSTFSLLGQIFYLQAGAIKGIRPTLTIPVGR